ncbi:M20 aminoacylase family protein [Asaia lannensis]|uniref:M20 family metallopeptidase n=1 Tax=Asaia lannensis NBRC 102526 TaxID=1307926 RepID=A0ABT1CJS5_9PROT|nr:M20 aminoacylase family protein [Asaia lannensis]MCO6161126.1 M20 family metallopeptidase [Asaia lannensis NBRC 102526]GBR01756.1 metal-dependent amidase [Asaia lannensis NBRC 102526]
MSSLLDALAPLKSEFVALRHDLHTHPELGFEEKRTSDIVADKLQSWGYEIERGFAGTGLVATLRNGRSKKTIGLRAEMDALPILEKTGLPWQSAQTGVSHMCGHDGHTTMLLCAARYLADKRPFDGTLHLIFQPAEELLCGGSRMIDDGLFDRYPCDILFAQHNMPGYPSGNFYFHKDASMASSDTVRITLNGMGGHGAFPQKSHDPVVASAQLVLALQSIVSRNIDPFAPAVVTIGALNSGSAANVIPDKAELLLSIRTMTDATRQLVLKRVSDLAAAIAKAHECEAIVDHLNGSPVLVNSSTAIDFAREVASGIVGADHCHESPPFMGSEDFAFMLQAHPNGCYWFVGNGTEGCNGTPLHNGGFDFNDDNIVPGAALFVGLVEKYLAPSDNA